MAKRCQFVEPHGQCEDLSDTKRGRRHYCYLHAELVDGGYLDASERCPPNGRRVHIKEVEDDDPVHSSAIRELEDFCA